MSKLCKCSTCCYFITAEAEFASHPTEAKSAGWRSGKRHCYWCGHGRIQEVCGGASCIPHQPFSNMFLMNTVFPYFRTFSITISLTPSARIIENVRIKCIISSETLRFRDKKFKQNLPKNCLKSTTMATTVCKFSKIFRGSMSPDPLEPFLFSICFKIILHEKYTLDNIANLGAPP